MKLCFLTFALVALVGSCHAQNSAPCDAICQVVKQAMKKQKASAKKEKATHPLDPLTWTEGMLANQLLFSSAAYNETQGFISYIHLLEPPKSEVLAWSKGKPLPPRSAYAIGTFFTGVTTETLTYYIDLTNRKVTYKRTGTCLDPPSRTDTARAQRSEARRVVSDPGVAAALGQRDLDPSSASCLPGSQNAGNPVVVYRCFANTNPGRSIGVEVTFDRRTQAVRQVRDSQLDPVKRRARQPKRLFKPATIERPQGVSFKVKQRQVTWGNWQFHVKLHQRVGLIISQAKYDEAGTTSGKKGYRSVLYKGSLSELFVPYMNPEYLPAYFDAGTYGIGTYTYPLIPLTDCPKNAYYLPAVFPSQYQGFGEPTVVPNAICIFERYSGDVATRHWDSYSQDSPEFIKFSGEPKISLVVRSWATIGNYDYGWDWEFLGDGTIKTSVNAAGYIATAYVNAENLKAANVDPTADGADGIYGTYVGPNQVGVVHDHFANFRLDLDVDGPSNSMVKRELVRQRLADTSNVFRSSIYEIQKKTAVVESDGQYSISSLAPAEYVITNPGKRSWLGNVVGYKLVNHNPIASLLDDDDLRGKQASFIKKSIWTTPYNADEMYAAGKNLYCFQPDGLAAWTKNNRAIKNKDIVVWTTVGTHHIPVQEDWYLMPTLTLSLELKPNNFFANSTMPTSTPYTAEELRVCK